MADTSSQPDEMPEVIEPEPPIAKKISGAREKILAGPVGVMMTIGSVALFAMMVLRVVDVGGRYFFKHPFTGADELVGFLLLCMAACGFTYAQSRHAHIRIDIMTEHLPLKARRILDVYNFVIAIAISALITWQLSDAARRYIFNLQGGSAVSEDLQLPFYPFMIILALGFAIYTLVLLVDTIISIFRVMNK
jgi:TRAP-type C4-dicarboxylate transport system permease small subunit